MDIPHFEKIVIHCESDTETLSPIPFWSAFIHPQEFTAYPGQSIAIHSIYSFTSGFYIKIATARLRFATMDAYFGIGQDRKRLGLGHFLLQEHGDGLCICASLGPKLSEIHPCFRPLQDRLSAPAYYEWIFAYSAAPRHYRQTQVALSYERAILWASLSSRPPSEIDPGCRSSLSQQDLRFETKMLWLTSLNGGTGLTRDWEIPSPLKVN